ncbi:MAG: hypothetical protein KKA42_01955 [candidate division Zixibacteria bacterium]|nr:hypothetical protein [candidate division Zixibacteria bacterium]
MSINSIAVRRLGSLLFLALMIVIPVSSFCHEYHRHDHHLLDRRIGYDRFDSDVKHSSHHHSHAMSEHIDWHVTRPQATNTTFPDNIELACSVPVVHTTDPNDTRTIRQRLLFVDEPLVSCPVVRGPPVLV